MFTGVALELWPQQDWVPPAAASEAFGLSSIWSMLGRPGMDLFWVFCLSILLQMLILIGPWHVQWTVDEGLMSHDAHLVLVLAMGFALVSLVRVGCAWLRGLVVVRLGHHLSFQLASRLLHHMLNLPLDWFERRHMGDITTRFGSLQPVRDFLIQGVAAILVDSTMVLLAMTLMLVYSWQIALMILAVHCGLGMINLVVVPYLRRLSLACIHAQAREDTQLIESIRAVYSIKVYAQEASRYQHWQRLHADTIQQNIIQQSAQLNLASLHQAVSALELVMVVYLAAQMTLDQQLTIGMLFAFISYRGQFAERMRSLLDGLVSYKTLQVHFERLGEIWQAPGDLAEFDADGITFAASQTELSCRQVGFRFSQTTPWLLRDFDLDIAPGEFVAIVGASGVGKTTLLKLLMGLATPDEGEVLLGGIRLCGTQAASFRQLMGCVVQDDVLFKGSVLENITLDRHVDHHRVAEVVAMVGLHQLLANLPMGYASQIGDIGEHFSAGQKQRLLLARALYQNPAYLFLDEPTANLDARNAASIGGLLSDLSCTRVMVTHDEQLATMADRVIHLQQSSGTNAVLLETQQLSVQGG